jgi:hypothetical protein
MLLLRNRAGSTGPPRRRGKVLRLQADSVLLSPVVPRPYRLRVSAAHGRLHFLRPTFQCDRRQTVGRTVALALRLDLRAKRWTEFWS